MQNALLIDKNYMALSIIPWRKAVKLLVKGKAEPIHGSDEDMRTISISTGDGAFNLPSIIRLVVTIPWRAHKSRLKFSRRNVMIRDNNECQYCGDRLGRTGGTIDHVVPRAHGGQTSYLNCVACCRACNNYKADRTPEQAGMRLRSKPKRPTFMVMYRHYLERYYPEEWADYIIGYST